MNPSHLSFQRTSSRWPCPCVKLHMWRFPSPNLPQTLHFPCVFGIALPTQSPDTLCGCFYMTGKVETITETMLWNTQITKTHHVDTLLCTIMFECSMLCKWKQLFSTLLHIFCVQWLHKVCDSETSRVTSWVSVCPKHYGHYTVALDAQQLSLLFSPPGQMPQPFRKNEKLCPCGQPREGQIPLPSQEVWC